MTDLHGLVIGVDRHEPSRGADGRPIPDLAGAVADALQVARYLREGPFAVPAKRLWTLIAPSRFSDLPWPGSADLPTYANIVRAISTLGNTARPGDQALIHFSGHGVRVPSAVRVKGRGARDEALVPCDAGSPEGGVLRDVEMHYLLSRLADAGLYVTLVFDACHAGGATRGATAGPDESTGEGRVRVRGLGDRSGDWGPRESLCGAWTGLYRAAAATERAGHRPGYRHFGGESGWFPQPERCVLLAACRGIEVAHEQPWDGHGVGGAFTHCLLDALDSLGGATSYKDLLGSVQRRIYGMWSTQTPILEGDGALQFLGAGRRPVPHPSSAVDAERPRVECRVGLDGTPGDAGARLLESLPTADGTTRVELVPDHSGRADLYLGTVAGSAVEIRDPFGTPLPEAGEPIPLDAPEAPRALARRLEHLALYGWTRDLAAPAGSPLRGALRLGLFGLERKEDWDDPGARRPIRGDRVPKGLPVCLLVRNRAEQALNAVVVDLRPDWAIERVHPAEHEAEHAVLEPGRDHPVFLRTWLPDGMSEARTLLKVIAAVGPIAADGYVLPALSASNGCLDGLHPGAPSAPPANPEGDLWTTAEMEITVFG